MLRNGEKKLVLKSWMLYIVKKNKKDSDELRPEYYRDDLGDGVRGKYYKHFKSGTNLVLFYSLKPRPLDVVRELRLCQ